MKKQNFFATDFGRQTLAFLLILLSFPVICCGFRFSLEALVYMGMGLIVAGMAIAPVSMVIKLFSNKK